MKKNSILTKYTCDCIDTLIKLGKVPSKFDSAGNLLINYVGGNISETSISIPLSSINFDSDKVEEKYDVVIREFPTQ